MNRSLARICLLLLAGGVDARGISFPSPGPSRGSLVDSTAAHGQMKEGIDAVRSIANVVLDILDNEAVRTSPKNWVVSPLSLTAMISQLLLGSRGPLQTTLADSLSLDGGARPTSRLEVHRQLGRLMRTVQRSSNETYTLELSNGVFIQPEIRLKPSYEHALRDFYNTHIFNVDFASGASEATDTVNDWVRRSTRGKLPKLYANPLPTTTVSLLANVVYFTGTWQFPFSPHLTSVDAFHVDESRQVRTEFMYGERELLYRNASQMQLLGIPYKNWEVVLYVLVPHDRLTTRLSVDELDGIISSAERENITLAIPKLKMLSAISLRRSVLKYLMKSDEPASRTVILADENAAPAPAPARSSTSGPRCDSFDVGGASDDARFRVGDVVHQVSMEIDEKGSELAAASASLVDYAADNFFLKIDRPFWFFIRHEDTSTHLFWGRVVDPSVHRN